MKLACKPFIAMTRHELVISQMRISAAHAIDFFALSGAESFGGIEAPDAFEQPLPPQDVVNPGDAARVLVCRIEKGGVCVRDLVGAAKQFGRDGFSGAREAPAFRVELDGLAGPDRPVPEQAADDSALDASYPDTESERRQQIQNDIVVVARVEGDVFASGFGDSPDDVQRLVAVERRYFYGNLGWSHRPQA